MGLLKDSTEDVTSRYEELCRSLNLDSDSANQAWTSYEGIQTNYTLEGEQLHWLGCALYVACRKVSPPSVGHSETPLQGNGVNLTRLLRQCNLSLIQFFNKSKQWVNMASLPPEYRKEIERLERNFEVSTEMFKKFQPIFNDMFLNTEESPKHPRSRKQRSIPCTTSKMFEFCWTLFVYVKGIVPDISDDIVNSYHYLLACCDLMFGNTILADRRDLVNPSFAGVPQHWGTSEYEPPTEAPCVLDALCKQHDGIELEAKYIREYHWKICIRSLFQKKILKGDANSLSGILDQGSFDQNLKAVNKEYEAYVLNNGDFDERIFLAECRRLRALRKQNLSTPSVLRAALQELNTGDDGYTHIGSTSRFSDMLDQSQRRSTEYPLKTPQHLVPPTPLTGRTYLRGREPPVGGTPISTATHSVSHLHTLLSGRTAAPSATLEQIFSDCENNPKEKIESRVNDLGALFCSKYTQASPESSTGHIDFANKRFYLAKTLYYKLLEDILVDEKRKKPNLNLNTLASQDIFHHCLLACCLEIVIYSYNSQRKFPWVLEALTLDAYHFYKVIEPIVSIKDHLSRDVVKHLNLIEEQILQGMAWKQDSPLWASITDSGQLVPSCEDVSIPNQFITPSSMSDGSDTPLRTTNTLHRLSQLEGDRVVPQSPSVPQSPISSASERFQSPVPSNIAKKRLFQDYSVSRTIKPGQSVLQNPTKMYLKISGDSDKLIPVLFQPPTPSNSIDRPHMECKAKRGGSLGLFFRKFYKLASVRMIELCNKLDVTDQEVRQKIWTCFEHSIIKHTDLMRDRHLDQVLMCAVYVICRVSGEQTERSFTDIMRCYRMQPQATSHVYRSVRLDPTPNQMPANESRGDLIKFYNTNYIKKMQNFAFKFSSRRSQAGPLQLSPLPSIRPQTSSPTRRISGNVSVRLLNNHNVLTQSPETESLVYCFSRSPAKDLRAINNMISFSRVGKRLLTDDPIDDGAPPAKQAAPIVTRKLQGLFSDRHLQSKD